ncbi:MAG: tetratricopeptide repeat protein, partial [Alphaproteobacteria bacterium]|nr:tetratricopeptide repeat protein [Alphaproteobacteria bacterium]
ADPGLERPFQWLQVLGASDEAMRLLRWITRTAPHQTDAWGWLAVLLHVGGDPAAAAPLYDEALKGRSDDVETLYKKGRALEDGGAVGEAETLYRHLEARMPNDHRVPFQLGLALHGQGRLAEAAAAYDRALFLAPAKGDIAANLAACQLNDPATTLDELCRSRRRWNARIERPGGPRPRPPRRDVAAPLSIGFVSGDFHTHQVAFLTVRTIEGLRAATPARIVCYANQTEADAMTARFQAAAHLWRPIRGLDDQSVADLIRGDGIDVLIDMSGLFVRNRLPMFVRRPAPLAVGWPCFTGATGLDEMDALLADAAEIPDRDEPLYSEHVLRMPGCWITWDPYAHAPPPAPPPSAAGGPVTFGSLSNPQKFNSRLAALWARVLDAVPGSRLLLRYAGLETPVLAERIRTLFKVNGVPADRLFLEGHAPRREFLARYGAVDVALDPWPYSGGVTTLEALWMGVPVVSLPGPAFPGRHSASILGALGLGDWIARDEDDYVAIAARLAADLPGRTALRHGLRQRIDVSPLCDGASHARHMYALLARCFDSEGRVRLPPPPAPEAGDLFRQAWACHNDGRTAEASRNYQAALVLEPRLGHALQNLGVIAFREDRLAEAKALFTHTTGLVPRDATARFNLGMVLDRLGETNACLASFRAAVILDPGHWGAFDLMGRLWWEKKSQAAAALGCFAAAAVLSPRDAGSRANKAAMLRSIDRPAEAIREAKAAVALTPGLAAALSILGNANTMAGRVRESLPFYRMAAHAEPAGAPLAHWNESLSRLMLGGFREGWELYEYRWKAPGFPSPRRDFTQPPWDGSPLDGRTVLVHWEQGFGDTLQFVRYLPMVGARGVRMPKRPAASVPGPGWRRRADRGRPNPAALRCLRATAVAAPAVRHHAGRHSRPMPLSGGGSRAGRRVARPSRRRRSAPPNRPDLEGSRHPRQRPQQVAAAGLAGAAAAADRHPFLQPSERRRRRGAGGRAGPSGRRGARLRRQRRGDDADGSGDHRRHRARPSGRRPGPAGLGFRALFRRLALDARPRGLALVSHHAPVPPAGAGRVGNRDRENGGRVGGAAGHIGSDRRKLKLEASEALARALSVRTGGNPTRSVPAGRARCRRRRDGRG